MSRRRLSASSAFDPLVKVSFALTMRAMVYAAAQGYAEYIDGVVDVSRALPLMTKLNDRFGIDRTANQRYRIKEAGGARFALFLYPRSDSTALDWFLFKTPGQHPNLALERWRSIKNPRLEWRGYELVELPYTKAERANWITRNPGLGTSSMTWCMSDDTMRGWRKRIRSSLNHAKKSPTGNDQLFRQALQSLAGVPGHRVCRRQVFELRQYINDQRRRLKLAPHEWSAPIPYLGARRCTEYPLSMLVTRSVRGEATWFPVPDRGNPSGLSQKLGYRIG
eukprot:TRINITY_DN22394_c0_g1_i2.p1 TRINITY_DN22394_c0_g1~~TRINITY_DN22394_c0_g1_i2.p1  ORF type:complete len:279 (-),score=24.67 TRINITY_DN22394_c0_g1_i2:632-1468(-)